MDWHRYAKNALTIAREYRDCADTIADKLAQIWYQNAFYSAAIYLLWLARFI